MQLSRKCEIAIDTLVLCALRPGETIRTADAAAFANTTKAHAQQVIVRLVRAGLLAAIRGSLGGIRLGRDAAAIEAGEVVRLLDPNIAPTESNMRNAAFKRLLGDVTATLLQTFDAITIADLAGEGKDAAGVRRRETAAHTGPDRLKGPPRADLPASAVEIVSRL